MYTMLSVQKRVCCGVVWCFNEKLAHNLIITLKRLIDGPPVLKLENPMHMTTLPVGGNMPKCVDDKQTSAPS